MKRISRFAKDFSLALLRSICEDPEFLGPLVLVFVCCCVVCLFGFLVFGAVHDFAFDWNSDVASRLSGLSIDPDKWKFLS
jgi:hypothetical protein